MLRYFWGFVYVLLAIFKTLPNHLCCFNFLLLMSYTCVHCLYFVSGMNCFNLNFDALISEMTAQGEMLTLTKTEFYICCATFNIIDISINHNPTETQVEQLGASLVQIRIFSEQNSAVVSYQNE